MILVCPTWCEDVSLVIQQPPPGKVQSQKEKIGQKSHFWLKLFGSSYFFGCGIMENIFVGHHNEPCQFVGSG